jgi:predicted RNase H-like nuclease (RuvC/YqgF family)
VSNEERPEFQALEELREVLSALSNELAAWRRRALTAEAEQTQLQLDSDVVANRERMVGLQSENAELKQRLEAAHDRVSELISRLRFLEEQVAMEEQGS